MARVMIKCPATSNAIDTEVNDEKESFDAAILEDMGIDCPHCRQVHGWSKADAFLEGGGAVSLTRQHTLGYKYPLG